MGERQIDGEQHKKAAGSQRVPEAPEWAMEGPAPDISVLFSQGARAVPRTLSHTAVAALQRTAGNAAVNWLLRQYADEQRAAYAARTAPMPLSTIAQRSAERAGEGALHAVLAVNQRESHQPSSSAARPGYLHVQRQVLSKIEIIPAGDQPVVYWIGDVVIGGRTPSPFPGTMGAHSTAWVAHIDVVRRYLVNTQLAAGIEWLVGLAQSELDGPLAHVPDDDEDTPEDDLSGMLDADHKKKLKEARAQLESQITAANNAEEQKAPVEKQVQALRALIDGYLTLVNYLPAATVRGGDPGGHGEGSARGDINMFEYVCANVKGAGSNAFPQEFIAMLDTLKGNDFYRQVKAQANARFTGDNSALQAMLVERLWTLFAAETPDIFTGNAKSKRLHVWKAVLHHFIATIRKAYPYTFDFTKMHEPANQITGLNSAVINAGITIDPTFTQTLINSLTTTDPQNEEAETRDDFSEVALSDFYQGGTGFQSSLLMQGDVIGDVDLIGAVDMIGRTQSPFSKTMGAHSTAWIAHLDALRQTLINKSLDAAIAALMKKAREALTDHSLKLANLIDEKHQVYLIGAYNVLSGDVATDTSSMQNFEKMSYLEKMIRDFLTYLNFLPLSTVEAGGVPGGRSEGKHRAFLLNYEDYGASIIPRTANKQELLQKHLIGLYDPSAAANFPPSLGSREDINLAEYVAYDNTHPLRKFIENKDRQSGRREKGNIVNARFYETILEAYPRSTLDSGLLKENKREQNIDERGKKIIAEEGTKLDELMQQNNCLINAIKKAATGDNNAQVTPQELIAIRMRIGEIGTMLFASERIISIIREVLNIRRGIVVIYMDGRPSEDFGDTTHNPVMIRHNGALHFEPMPLDETHTIAKNPVTGSSKRRHDDKSRSSGGSNKQFHTDKGTDK